MDKASVTTAVIGIGATGHRFARALKQCDSAELVGLADHDDYLIKDVSQEFDIPGFTDTRQMLLSLKPEAVFLAVPPASASDLMTFCVQQNICVFKAPPLGRNLGEAAGFARMFQEAEIPLAVGPLQRFNPSYLQLAKLKDKLGELFQASGHFHFHWGRELKWRADAHAAGGGALLELAYPLLDTLNNLLGLPEDVYTIASVIQGDVHEDSEPNGLHDTDDLASLLLRYPCGLTATMQVNRLSGPFSEGISLLGQNGSGFANPDTCLLRQNDGAILEHIENTQPPLESIIQQIESFLLAIHEEKQSYPGLAAEQLYVHAVIEAAYLSARTGKPESPKKQLHIHGL